MLRTLVLALLLALVLNFVVFLVAYRLQTDKLTDITWSVTFIVLILLDCLRTKHLQVFSAILALMVVIWSLRLGSFLLYRVLKKGKDRRFDDKRASFLGFLRFWVGQAVAAWLLLLPTTFAIARTSTFRYISIFGLAIWIIGVVVEATADLQKYIFTTKPQNKGRWIDSGLWHFSRHPNYFGEILVWLGVYVYCLGYLPLEEAIIGVVSPITIVLLLGFVSGIPILEQHADEKWGANPEYRKYKQRTHVLLPIAKS